MIPSIFPAVFPRQARDATAFACKTNLYGSAFSLQTRKTLNQCWFRVVDGGPTLSQHWFNVLLWILPAKSLSGNTQIYRCPDLANIAPAGDVISLIGHNNLSLCHALEWGISFRGRGGHEAMAQRWFEVGPASWTVCQRWINVGSMSVVCCDEFVKTMRYLLLETRGVGLIPGQRRGRWTNVKPTLNHSLVLTGIHSNNIE